MKDDSDSELQGTDSERQSELRQDFNLKSLGDWDAVQLVECLPSAYESLDWIPCINRMVCTPVISVRQRWVEKDPKFKAFLSYTVSLKPALIIRALIFR